MVVSRLVGGEPFELHVLIGVSDIAPIAIYWLKILNWQMGVSMR